jgi:hypothetical protein
MLLFSPGYAIISRLLRRHHWITQAPPATDGELLPVVLPIADLVSKLLPHVFLLLMQQKDLVTDPCNTIFVPQH